MLIELNAIILFSIAFSNYKGWSDATFLTCVVLTLNMAPKFKCLGLESRWGLKQEAFIASG